MNNEKRIERFKTLLDARLARQPRGNGRAAGSTTSPSPSEPVPEIERSEHGVALDELTRLREDPEADLLLAESSQGYFEKNSKKLARRADLENAARRAAAAAETIPGPTQAEYEADRAGILKREKLARLDAEIEAAQARRAAFDAD